MSQRKNFQQPSGIHSILGHLIHRNNISYSKKTFLGEGSFGTVYKVDLNDDTLKQLTYQGKPLQWVFKQSRYKFTEECKIQSRFYVTCTPFKKEGYYYTFTEFLPGIDLEDYKIGSFSERMTILCQLASQISDYHHFTRLGSPFIHGDLKSANIKVDIDKKNHQINTYIYDFGFSSTHNTDNSKVLFRFKNINSNSLNASYFPKEALEGKFGYKTDVYMFGRVAYRLLKSIPPNIASLQPTIEIFLKSMLSSDYANRPTSDEVLKFFTTLNRLHLLKEKNITDLELEKALNAKLVILSKGMWNLPMTFKTNWADFDFESYPEVSKTICLLNQKSLLNRSIGTLLVANSNVPPAIQYLNSVGLLNEATLTMLDSNSALADELKSEAPRNALLLLIDNCSAAMNQKELENFFTKNKTQPDIVTHLFRREAKRLPISLLNQGLNTLIQHNETIPLYLLSQASGTLNDKRTFAKKIINHRLIECETPDQVMKLLETLKNFNYLFQRQGFFEFFSLHNHKYQGQKVSGTWLEIVKLHEERIKALGAEATAKNHNSIH